MKGQNRKLCHAHAFSFEHNVGKPLKPRHLKPTLGAIVLAANGNATVMCHDNRFLSDFDT